MVDPTPTDRELLLLARIAANIAITLTDLATGDLQTDLAASIDLKLMAKKGLIFYAFDGQVVRCTKAGRAWVYGHENWRVCIRPTPGGGH